MPKLAPAFLPNPSMPFFNSCNMAEGDGKKSPYMIKSGKKLAFMNVSALKPDDVAGHGLRQLAAAQPQVPSFDIEADFKNTLQRSVFWAQS
ncbi:hypothetical protein J1614_003443 [Plenodomus biglobosus]|nr:hypothetical protein J1614_003443 [Plenodomus biglobosus]